MTALDLLKKLEGKTIAEVKGINQDGEGGEKAVYVCNVEIHCTDGSIVEIEGVPLDFGDCAAIKVKTEGVDSFWGKSA